MKFDFHTFAADASAILGAVQRMAPIASELGIPFVSAGAAMAGKLAEVGQAALDQADNLETALTSQDQATLTDLIAKLNEEAEQAEAAAEQAEAEILEEQPAPPTNDADKDPNSLPNDPTAQG